MSEKPELDRCPVQPYYYYKKRPQDKTHNKTRN
jgi:hypothetical protein